MAKRAALVVCINHTQKYTSLKAAHRHIAAGRAAFDEDHRLVFRDIGKVIRIIQQDRDCSGVSPWRVRPSAGFHVLQIATPKFDFGSVTALLERTK